MVIEWLQYTHNVQVLEYCLGERRRRENRGAWWDELWEGCPLSSRLGGLGSVVSLPPAGSGAEPRPENHLAYFEGHRTLPFALTC